MGAAPSLSEVFGFTEAQLSSNREGQLSEGQTSALWGAMLWGVPFALAALLLGLAAIKHARGVLRVVGPLLGAIAAASLVGLLAYPSLRDLMDPTVAVAEDVVTEQVGTGKGPGRAVLTIGGHRLVTEGETMPAAAAIDRRTVYRAYYLSHTKRLLSIEPVTASP